MSSGNTALCSLIGLVLLAAGCGKDLIDGVGAAGGAGGGGASSANGGSGGGPVGPCANVDCDDENPCTTDECDANTGECLHPAAEVVTVPQVDGDCKQAKCEGTEIVQSALATDVPVDDGNDCTDEVCDGDEPDHPPVAAGEPCNEGAGVCDATGLCSVCDVAADCGTDTACATYACSNGACDATYFPGTVVSGDTDGDCKAMQCVDLSGDPQLLPFVSDIQNDSNPCTTDTCSAAGNPVHTNVANNTPCSDGLFCNGADTCNASGTCVHPGDPCAGGGECADGCNEVSDSCFDPAGTACGSNANTACSNPDTCNGSGVCQANNEPAGFACNDNLFCNGADTCDASGTCANHTGNPCAGGTECSDACNEATDNCFDPAGTACGSSSNTACSNPDTCNGTGSCSPNNEAAGTACSDGVFCNGADTCNPAGSCANHTGDPCLPLNPTNNDCSESCNEATGNCTANDPNGSACSGGTCQGGTCI